MKKIFLGLLMTSLFVACNDDDKTDVDVKTAPVTPGIDNVEGNIPDTTRAIRLEHPLPDDSSRLDSTSQR